MKLSSNNYDFLDFYDILDYDSLSFKDKLIKFMGDKDLSIQKVNFDNECTKIFYDLIKEIKENNLKTIIISDYDCDGICSLVMLLRLFEKLNIKANYYIPSRSIEGYGINMRITDMIIEHHFEVVITLDNGIVAYEQMDKLTNYHIKSLVIDHHLYSKLPNSLVIHPLLLHEYYHGLCTSGLVYFLSKHYYEDDYLSSLALIGTLGDMVEVFKANREILLENIIVFNRSDNVLKRLLNQKDKYDYEDISFQLVPKLNAISRLDPIFNLNHLIKYFKDNVFDLRFHQKILEINDLRKRYTDDMYQIATKLVDDNPISVVFHRSFKEGLCGIVAARLASENHKPIIVLSQKESCLIGSGRSINGYDLFDSIKDFDYKSFGGHKMALGLSIAYNKFDEFKNFITTKRFQIEKSSLIKITCDEVNLENYQFMKSLEPFGSGYNKPRFYLVLNDIKSIYLIKGLYPKYHLSQNVDAIAFNINMFKKDAKGLIGYMKLNSYNGKTKIDFIIDDVVY